MVAGGESNGVDTVLFGMSQLYNAMLDRQLDELFSVRDSGGLAGRFHHGGHSFIYSGLLRNWVPRQGVQNADQFLERNKLRRREEMIARSCDRFSGEFRHFNIS